MSFYPLSPSSPKNQNNSNGVSPEKKLPTEVDLFLQIVPQNEVATQHWVRALPKPNFNFLDDQNEDFPPRTKSMNFEPSTPRKRKIVFNDDQEGMQTPLAPQYRICPINRQTPLTPGRFAENHPFSLTGKLKVKGVTVELIPFSFVGSHMSVFTITAKTQIYENIDNESIMLKKYNKRMLRKSEIEVERLFLSSLYHYSIAQNLKLSVAKIYNFTTAGSDKYLIQEKIPYEVDVNNPKHVKQVQEFFVSSLTSGTPMDLIPDNLRVKEDGTVVLIDFVEDASNNTCTVFINKAIIEWGSLFAKNNDMNRSETKKFLKDLTQNFSKYNFECDLESILSEIFFSVSDF